MVWTDFSQASDGRGTVALRTSANGGFIQLIVPLKLLRMLLPEVVQVRHGCLLRQIEVAEVTLVAG